MFKEILHVPPKRYTFLGGRTLATSAKGR